MVVKTENMIRTGEEMWRTYCDNIWNIRIHGILLNAYEAARALARPTYVYTEIKSPHI